MTKEKLAHLRSLGYEFGPAYDAMAERMERATEATQARYEEAKRKAAIALETAEDPICRAADPTTGTITAEFVFDNQLTDPYTKNDFAAYVSFFMENVRNVYKTVHAIANGTSRLKVTNQFTHRIGTRPAGKVACNEFYIVVRNPKGTRSYATPWDNTASMNIEERGNAPAHEVAHLLGLADRYHYYGVYYTNAAPKYLVSDFTYTRPFNLMPGVDDEYSIESDNLMSKAGPLLTTMQWQRIFQQRKEQSYTVATFYVHVTSSEHSALSGSPKAVPPPIPSLSFGAKQIDKYVFGKDMFELLLFADKRRPTFAALNKTARKNLNKYDSLGWKIAFYVLNEGKAIINYPLPGDFGMANTIIGKRKAEDVLDPTNKLATEVYLPNIEKINKSQN